MIYDAMFLMATFVSASLSIAVAEMREKSVC